MCSTLWLCCLSLAASGDAPVLDTFDYATDEALRLAWVVQGEGGTGEFRSVSDDSGRVVECRAPFGNQPGLRRVFVDRSVKLDLATAGEVAMEVAADDPKLAGRLTLYFRSGPGWYAAGSGFQQAGWHTLKFSKADFKLEGKPVGWHQIDQIRIAIWRGPSANVSFRMRRLAAVQHDIAVVVPGPSATGDRATAFSAAERVSDLLDQLGLGSDAVEEPAVAHGALGNRRVAVLAYNPRLEPATMDALEAFVDRGGRLFVCYQLAPAMGQLLGVGNPRYIRPKAPSALATMRFNGGVDGLPSIVRQASWNITAAEPAGKNARVIGTWFDSEDRPTNLPAVILSDTGVFMTHIILEDDPVAKRKMLAALVGKLAPSLWKQMADRSLAQVVRVGHLRGQAELRSFIESGGSGQALEDLRLAERLLETSHAAYDRQQFRQVVELAEQARTAMVSGYCRAQPSPEQEGRACWNHSGTGAYPGDWDRTARELAEAGMNMVLPNMLWGGVAHYASDVLPRSATYRQYGDQIAQAVKAAHQHGLEIHVWKVNFNLQGAPESFVDSLRREKRLQVDAAGKQFPWLCPSDPRNQQLEYDSLMEVVEKYDVDGIHFDYIRYPGRDKCYCPGCRKRFETQLGRGVKQWPGDCYRGELAERYTQWRCDQITQLVRRVHEGVKKKRASVKISAAVFGAYPSCRESVAQDWPAWVRAGYLDFICPMDYTTSDPQFIGLVNDQMSHVAGRVPIYAGIGQWKLSDDRTIGQILHARRQGAAGFTLFNLTSEFGDSLLPALRKGVGARAATPPHD